MGFPQAACREFRLGVRERPVEDAGIRCRYNWAGSHDPGAHLNSVLTSLVAYVAAASLLTVTPGLDTALVLRTATAGTPRRAALAGLGIAAGCFVWAALVAFGLGALLAASQLAYTVLRWIGAAYLLWVGYKMLRHPRRAFLTAGQNREPQGAAFVTGALTNLPNPKVGVFYVSFLPQFVPLHVWVANARNGL